MEIIDNALEDAQWRTISRTMLSDDFEWFMERTNEGGDNFYWVHEFRDLNGVVSRDDDLIYPLLNILEPKAITRVKGNLYDGKYDLETHEWHEDYGWEHKAAIYYVNDNDGYTEFKDGTKVESVANRLLLFDGSQPHRSTNCTYATSNVRLNINFNYF